MHITWSAILGGAVFAAVRNGRFRITPLVAGAYLLVATLHGVWDEVIPAVAHRLAQGIDADFARLVHPSADWMAVQAHISREASLTSFAVQVAGYAALIGVELLILRAVVRDARRREECEAPAARS